MTSWFGYKSVVAANPTQGTITPTFVTYTNSMVTASALNCSYTGSQLAKAGTDLTKIHELQQTRDIHQHPAYAHKRWLEIYNAIQEREDKTPTKEDLALMEETLRPSTTWCYYNELMEQEKAKIEDVEARRFVVEKLTVEYR